MSATREPAAGEPSPVTELPVTELPVTDRTRLRRHPERGRFDRATVDAILDEALICHLGFAVDGRPFVVPTVHARVGDVVYVHGAVRNHALTTLAAGAETCLTVTLIDGLVLARSAFHHSVNYRSVMLFAPATRVDDADEKRVALDAIVEHLVPGRTADARPPSDAELRATLVVRLPLAEASAKVRTGPPIDDPADLDLPVWAGVLPLRVEAGVPEPDAGVTAAPPGYLRDRWR